MLHRKRIRSSLLALLAIVLVMVFSGCQTVGGLDVTKALTQSWSVPSFEGTESIAIDFANSGSAKPADPGQLDWTALSGAKLNLTNWKKQDNDHESFDGQLLLAGGKTISLKGSVTQGALTLQVEGGSNPIVFPIASLFGSSSDSASQSLPLDPGSLLGKPGVGNLIVPYFITNMPNPQNVAVTPSTQTINGQSLQLQKLHMELDGKQFGVMLSSAIGSMLSDEASLKELVGQIVKVLYPPSKDGLDISGFATDLALGTVKEMLGKYKDDIGQLGGVMQNAVDPKTSLVADFYIDSSLYVRRTDWALTLSQPNGAGYDSLKLSGTADLWNQGQPVQAAMIPSTDGAYVWGSTTGKLPLWIKSLDSKSNVYDFFMNGLHITRKSIKMAMTDNSGGDENNPKPFIENGTTFVPVRFVTERLDSSVDWNNDTRQATVKDLWSGKTLVFTIDSNEVSVNGVDQAMMDGDTPINVKLTNNTTYVPIRFIAEQFGAQVGWDQATSTVSIVKP